MARAESPHWWAVSLKQPSPVGVLASQVGFGRVAQINERVLQQKRFIREEMNPYLKHELNLYLEAKEKTWAPS